MAIKFYHQIKNEKDRYMGIDVSLIVPVYNCEKYISECIESILAQTFKKFELLLINDGSNDSSYQVCEEYAAKDSRIRVFTQQNAGVARTRERGYHLSTGKYIVFVDADDTLEPDYLQVMLSGMEESKADVICCNSIDEGIINRSIEHAETIVDRSKLIEAYISGKRHAYNIWAKMFRKEILEGVTFRPQKYAEDTFYVNEVFQRADRVQLIPYAGYHYRDNVNGAIHRALHGGEALQQSKDILCFLIYMRNLCMEKYTEYVDQFNKLVGDCLFSLIINASVLDNDTKKEVNAIVLKTIRDNEFLCGMISVKFWVVWIYKYCPNIVYTVLSMYRRCVKKQKG